MWVSFGIGRLSIIYGGLFMNIIDLKENEIAAISGGLFSTKTKIIMGLGITGIVVTTAILRQYSGSIIIGACTLLGGIISISKKHSSTKVPIANSLLVFNSVLATTFVSACIGAYLDKMGYRDPISVLLQYKAQ